MFFQWAYGLQKVKVYFGNVITFSYLNVCKKTKIALNQRKRLCLSNDHYITNKYLIISKKKT